jgi:hydroxymethylpyrimidine/phosphomethylpyrimidine kinase
MALAIAGSDPGGGAGIQADLATFAALGVLGTSAITALTVQSPRGVRSVHPVDPDLVIAQIDCLLADLPAGALRAVKIGMLGSGATARSVGARLSADDARALPLVLDPVLSSKNGRELLGPDGLAALEERLFPRADVLTPNLDEAAALLGRPVGDVLARPEQACRDLVARGPRAVVLKGGHAGGRTSEDLLYAGGRFTRLSAERVMTPNDHGTGCAFASALAAHLALGADLERAARGAKEFVTQALEAARDWDFGSGAAGPLHLGHGAERAFGGQGQT